MTDLSFMRLALVALMLLAMLGSPVLVFLVVRSVRPFEKSLGYSVAALIVSIIIVGGMSGNWSYICLLQIFLDILAFVVGCFVRFVVDSNPQSEPENNPSTSGTEFSRRRYPSGFRRGR